MITIILFNSYYSYYYYYCLYLYNGVYQGTRRLCPVSRKGMGLIFPNQDVDTVWQRERIRWPGHDSRKPPFQVEVRFPKPKGQADAERCIVVDTLVLCAAGFHATAIELYLHFGAHLIWCGATQCASAIL